VDAIEHTLVAKIESIPHMRQTCLKGKEYLVKYKGCHHKKLVWMKPIHLNHLLEMVNKFGQKRGSYTYNEKKTKKKDPPTNGLSVDEGINPF
jgi:hypothetical protein